MMDIVVKIVLAVLVIAGEGVTCDVWIATDKNSDNRYCRRLRSVVDDPSEGVHFRPENRDADLPVRG
jgi:hypothetical protein